MVADLQCRIPWPAKVDIRVVNKYKKHTCNFINPYGLSTSNHMTVTFVSSSSILTSMEGSPEFDPEIISSNFKAFLTSSLRRTSSNEL